MCVCVCVFMSTCVCDVCVSYKCYRWFRKLFNAITSSCEGMFRRKVDLCTRTCRTLVTGQKIMEKSGTEENDKIHLTKVKAPT